MVVDVTTKIMNMKIILRRIMKVKFITNMISVKHIFKNKNKVKILKTKNTLMKIFNIKKIKVTMMIIIIIMDRTLCTHSMIIISWWCSSPEHRL